MTFCYYDGQWKFSQDENILQEAAQHHGMGFSQSAIIFDSETLPLCRKATSSNFYRALCEIDGKLCIVDSKEKMYYKDFVAALEKQHVKYAIYMDMGPGWNFSWYKDNDLHTHYLRDVIIKYTTNWIAFYK